MFVGEVEEKSIIGRIGSETDGNCETNDQLRLVRQIEGVTCARRDERRYRPVDMFRFIDVFFPVKDGFEHEVEIFADSVDRTRAKVVIPKIVVVDIRKDGAAGVKVQRPAVTDDLAKRQIDFVAESIVTKALVGIADRQNEREAGRERGCAFAFHERL